MRVNVQLGHASASITTDHEQKKESSFSLFPFSFSVSFSLYFLFFLSSNSLPVIPYYQCVSVYYYESSSIRLQSSFRFSSVGLCAGLVSTASQQFLFRPPVILFIDHGADCYTSNVNRVFMTKLEKKVIKLLGMVTVAAYGASTIEVKHRTCNVSN